MRRLPLVFAAWLGLATGLCLAAAKWPRFPGDLAVTRAAQAVFPGDRAWARALTNMARPPASHLLLGVALLAGWRFARGRGALAAALALAAAHGLDRGLKPAIGRPRPPADLVEVAGSAAGWSCPSTFALVTAATLGFVAVTAVRGRRGASRWWIVSLCAGVLVAGGLARVVLGGHWASDILISWLLMAGVLAGLILLARPPRPGASGIAAAPGPA